MAPDVPGYVLHEVVGRGPSATVYRATQVAVDRPVAVKVLARGAAGADLRAVRALAGHPHVVEVIDTGTTADGAPFVVMDLVTAGSLGDRLRAFGPLAPTAAARAGAEVADALEAAHAAGIVHGRVSPDNVLVGRRGQALLADFAGSERHATPSDDVHDLGATVYSLVTGAPAPAGEAPPLPPEVPFALVDLIGASTAHDPGQRPPLAEMASVLEAIAADRATPPTTAAQPDEPRPPGPGAVLDATDRSSDAPARGPRAGGPPGVPTARLVVVAVLVALSMVAAVVLTLILG